MKGPNNVLSVALAARVSGTRCSALLGIESEVTALSFDLACSDALIEFENKRDFERAKLAKEMMKEAIGEALLGVKPPDRNEVENDDIDEDDVL